MSGMSSSRIDDFRRGIGALLPIVSALSASLRSGAVGRTVRLVATTELEATQELRAALTGIDHNRTGSRRGFDLVCGASLFLTATLPAKQRADRRGARLKEHFSVATPFELDEVVFASGISENGTFQVRYLPRATVEAWSLIAAETAQSIAQISFGTSRFTTRIRLGDNTGSASDGPLRWRLIVGCLGLGLLANAVFFHLELNKIDDVEARLATKAAALKKQIANTALSQKAMADHLAVIEMRSANRINDTLNRLAAALPSDTYITGFEVEARRILIRVDTVDGPALAPTLPSSSGLQFVRTTTIRSLADGRSERELLFERAGAGS